MNLPECHCQRERAERQQRQQRGVAAAPVVSGVQYYTERETVVIREAVLEEGYTKAARGVGCTRKRTTKLLLRGMRAPVRGEAEEPRRAAPGASMGEVSSLLLRGCSQELAS